jgi:hypothetical protein
MFNNNWIRFTTKKARLELRSRGYWGACKQEIESVNLGHGITFGILRLELFVELLRLDRILFRAEI